MSKHDKHIAIREYALDHTYSTTAGHFGVSKKLVWDLNRRDEVCKHFGCGKRLKYTEQLFGNRCFNHSIINHT